MRNLDIEGLATYWVARYVQRVDEDNGREPVPFSHYIELAEGYVRSTT